MNPARSTGPALFAGEWALGQLWLFWIAPLVGAVLAGGLYHVIAGRAADRPIDDYGTVEIPPERLEPAHSR